MSTGGGEVLPPPEARKARLKELEEVIAAGFEAMAGWGDALREVQETSLYLEVGASSFDSYVRSRWGFAIRTVYQYIDAAKIRDAVRKLRTADTDTAPAQIATESVARELAPILHQAGPEEVGKAWAAVSARYKDLKRPPTARQVHEVLVQEGFRAKPFGGGPSGGQKNTTILLGEVGDRIVAAENRLNWFLSREVPKAKTIAKSTRTGAAQWAERAEEIARKLREFADG